MGNLTQRTHRGGTEKNSLKLCVISVKLCDPYLGFLVTITVHDQDHAPLANATVTGTWSAGATGGAECTTDGSGRCSVVKGNLKTSVSSVTVTVDSVAVAEYSYAPAANHDLDSDSNGTSITVSAPTL